MRTFLFHLELRGLTHCLIYRSAAVCMALFFVMVLNAQYDQHDFVHYTIKEGLSDNNINCINQDDYGFIWIGTESGLNRYDGNQFEKYFQDSPAGFLTSSLITKVHRWKNHRLAIVTRNGLQVVNTYDFSIRQYFIPDTTSFSFKLNSFIDVVEFEDNTIGAVTATGFYAFDQASRLICRFDDKHSSDIGNKRVLYAKKIMNIPGPYAFIYGTEDRQGIYNYQHRKFAEVKGTENEWSMLDQPQSVGWKAISQLNMHEYLFLTHTDSILYLDLKDNRCMSFALPSWPNSWLSWLSNVFMADDTTYLINDGYRGFYVFYFNRNEGQIRFDPHRYFNEYKVNCFYKDKDGRLWIGTTEGLFKQRTKPSFTKQIHYPMQDQAWIGFNGGLRYKDKIFISRFSRDTGLMIVNPNTLVVEKKFNFYGKDNPFNEIVSMQMYYPDTLWLGTYGGLLWFDPNTYQYGKVEDVMPGLKKTEWSVLTLPRQDGYAWICDFLGGHAAEIHIPSRQFEFYDGNSEPPLPFLYLKHLCVDSAGDTWFGGHALARWNHTRHQFDRFLPTYGGPNPFEEDIKLLRADQQGSLWIHNVSNGLLRYEIQTGTWTHFGMKEGFPSERIQSMSIIRDHTLWLTCQNKLIRFDTRTGNIESYDQADGVPDTKALSANMYLDPVTDELYVFYKDDVLVIPFSHHRDTSYKNDVLISKVNVNNEHSFFFPDHALHLGAKENNLIIDFTTVDFHEGQPYRFAYRMHAYADWISLGQQRTLNLTNLSPGTYTVEVASISKSGMQKTKALNFSIAYPIYARVWFIAGSLVLISVIIYIIYRWRMQQVHQKAELDKLLSQTEMKALHAQMNPHFIFNSLNSIREMILNNETREASRFLGNFAHLIRITLDQSRQSFISLRNTMDYLTRYIEMEKIRNPDFHFQMEVDAALDPDETILPPLLIQPFIENAIWHGMNGEEKEINILVEFRKKGDQLICTIEDDGIGIDQSTKMKNGKNGAHQSVSIANIQKRIELLNRKHDLQSSISIKDKNLEEEYSGTGTIVSITLPLEIKEE